MEKLIMTNTQLNLFEMPEQPVAFVMNVKYRPSPPTVNVADIRTEAQQNRSISYDVGEKIGGARKDLAQQRKAFLEKPSSHLLNDLESQDTVTAAEVIIRDTFFNWFSLEDCRQRNVNPGIAKAIQLFINRIPKVSKDTKEDRLKYTNSLLLISDLLQTVKTKEEFYLFESRIIEAFTASQNPPSIEGEETYIASVKAKLGAGEYKSESVIKESILGLQKSTARLILMEQSFSLFRFKDYPGPFKNYFYGRDSRRTMLTKAFSIKNWDELLPPTTSEKPQSKGKVVRKPVWERTLPSTPVRQAGTEVHLTEPKAYVDHFNFRASEFGHYLPDDVAQNHLQRSAEAYTDLAELLRIPVKAVSHGGRLAMAFGSRGRGRALGHYEPARQVINLTKEKGSLGILAHEWFHSLDHYLYNRSYDFKNGMAGYVTEESYGTLPIDVRIAIEELVESIKIGDSTAYIDVKDCTNSYNLRRSFTELYEEVHGDLHRFMEYRLIDLDARIENNLRPYVGAKRERVAMKYAKQRNKHIRTDAEALAEYHFKQTGEKVERIPYPVDRSEYFQHAITMDKGQIGKYWSSNVELAARAFEFYIHEKLKEQNWTSDYLVCGIRDSVFPQNEKEKFRILYSMDKFIESIRPLLAD